MVGGVTVSVGLAVFCARSINAQRPRYFSDVFTMTPEAMRMPFHNISFVTSDGISLGGWFIPQTTGGKPSRRVVICCNPHNHDRSTMLGISRGLWEASYSVFLFNFRSHAHTKTRQTIGHLEKLDARAALEWVRQHKPENARVAFVGASMGGAVSLMIAEEEEDIAAVGTDCAFSTLFDVTEHLLIQKMPMLASLSHVRSAFMWLVCASNLALYGYDLRTVGPAANSDGDDGARALGNLRCPILLIHSENDSVVPVSSALKIFNGAATKEKELEVLPGVEHIGSYFRGETAYIKRFVRFLDKAFEMQEGNENVAEPKT